MFTGIIEDTAFVTSVSTSEAGKRFVVDLPVAGELKLGDSVAIDGVCLTVADIRDSAVSFDVMPETLFKTTMSDFTEGRLVNFERSMKMGDSFDGHFVQGHVDGVMKVAAVHNQGQEYALWFEIPHTLDPYVVDRGSIAINGVSLTVARREGNHLMVGLIPTTLEITNLGMLRAGDFVNYEADMLAKQIVQTMERYKDLPQQVQPGELAWTRVSVSKQAIADARP